MLRKVANQLGLFEIEKNRFARHPLVYLLEAADDICYGLIDLEDGIEMGLLRYDEVEDLLKVVLTEQWSKSRRAGSPRYTRRRLQALRGLVMEVLVTHVSQAFLRTSTSCSQEACKVI